MRLTKEFVQKKLASYHEAEDAILSAQGYRVGSRSIDRAKLAEIRAGIKYWENVLAALEAGRDPNAPRFLRVVPRDL